MLKKVSVAVMIISLLSIPGLGAARDLPEGLRAARTVTQGVMIGEPRPAEGAVILGAGDEDTLMCDDGSYGRWFLWESTWMAQGWEVVCPECPGEFVVTAAWFMTRTYVLPGGFPRHGYIFADRAGLPGAILWDVTPLMENSWDYPEPGWERIEVDPPVDIPSGERVWVGMNLRAQYPYWEANRGPYFVMDELAPPPRECADIAWGPYWTDDDAYDIYPIDWYHAPSWMGDLMVRLEGHCKGPPDLDIDDDYANLSSNVMHLIGVAGGAAVGAYVMAAPDSDLFNIDPWDGPGDCAIDSLVYKSRDLWLYGWEGNLEPPPWTRIQARDIDLNLAGVRRLGLGDCALNFVQVIVPSQCGRGDPSVWDFTRLYHGIMSVSGSCGEALDPCDDTDEFELRVSVVRPAHGPSACGFWGLPEKDGNLLVWSGLGFGQDGYNLYRTEGEEFEKLNSSMLTCDSYADGDVVDGGRYGYKLGLRFGDEEEILLGPIWMERSVTPLRYALYQNFPNPLRDETRIRYAITSEASVSLQVFNIAGQVVATLVDEHQSPGFHSVAWRAEDVPNGVYFYRLTARQAGGEAGDFSQTKKLVVIK